MTSHRSIALTLTVCLALLLAAAGPACAAKIKPVKVDPQTQAIAKANNRFTVDIYKAVLADKKGNLFLSPYSISTAMAMVHAGARGQTAGEIAAVLHLKGSQKQIDAGYHALMQRLNAGGKKGKYQLAVTNALWGQRGYDFLAPYTGTVEKQYGAGLFEVDFVAATEASRQRVNEWVEQKTNKKIKDLMPPGSITQDTRLVLTNAIYFKGAWAHPFDKRSTQTKAFKLSAKKTVKAPMMYQSKFRRLLETDDMQALQLPYAGDGLSMIVLLPKTVDGLAALEKKLTADNLDKWLGDLSRQGMMDVQTWLPKFTMTSKFNLNQTLSKMGMPTAFTSGADLSGINGRRDLFIQAVIHKAFVDVNEKGTEAAAATGISVGITAFHPTKQFKADHPFLFIIRDNATGAVLFLGRVLDPTAK